MGITSPARNPLRPDSNIAVKSSVPRVAGLGKFRMEGRDGSRSGSYLLRVGVPSKFVLIV